MSALPYVIPEEHMEDPKAVLEQIKANTWTRAIAVAALVLLGAGAGFMIHPTTKYRIQRGECGVGIGQTVAEPFEWYMEELSARTGGVPTTYEVRLRCESRECSTTQAQMIEPRIRP